MSERSKVKEIDVRGVKYDVYFNPRTDGFETVDGETMANSVEALRKTILAKTAKKEANLDIGFEVVKNTAKGAVTRRGVLTKIHANGNALIRWADTNKVEQEPLRYSAVDVTVRPLSDTERLELTAVYDRLWKAQREANTTYDKYKLNLHAEMRRRQDLAASSALAEGEGVE